MTSLETLEALGKRLRESALVYRSKADVHDRYACWVEVLIAATDEASAKKTLEFLHENMAHWFPS